MRLVPKPAAEIVSGEILFEGVDLLRLTDSQVADVATYLSTLKGTGGDQAKAAPDQKAADDVLLDYLKAVIRLASERDDLGPPLRAWLHDFVTDLPVEGASPS